MGIHAVTNPGRRAVYSKTQTDVVRTEKRQDVSAAVYAEDEMTVSQKAREAMAKQTAAPAEEAGGVTEELPDTSSEPILFPSFSGEFSKVTQAYSDQMLSFSPPFCFWILGYV